VCIHERRKELCHNCDTKPVFPRKTDVFDRSCFLILRNYRKQRSARTIRRTWPVRYLSTAHGHFLQLIQALSIERQGTGQDYQIVEVLHATVGDSEFQHRFDRWRNVISKHAFVRAVVKPRARPCPIRWP